MTPGIVTETKETTVTNTVYVPKDSLIYLPGDKVVIHDEIPCPDVEYHKQATSNTGRSTATVNISKGKLDVECKTDSLEARIKWLEANTTTVQKVVKETTITLPPKRWIPKWAWWLLGINVVYLAARILFFIYKVPIRI